MRHRVERQGGSQDAFTDVLFNVLLGFALMFIASLLLMQDPSKDGKTDPKACEAVVRNDGFWGPFIQ